MDCDKPEETERQAEGMTDWRMSMRDFAHPPEDGRVAVGRGGKKQDQGLQKKLVWHIL
ncbi:MAG: hypothetical protein LBQ51_01820 [Desulfovibrio sp.]|jgi:hypothetical protein|nr:hypothetical protein [Desulfovibrio sp.]